MTKRLLGQGGLVCFVLVTAGRMGLAQVQPAPAAATPKPAGKPRALTSPVSVKPHFVYQADKGFIDDPLALDASSGLAALLRTDSASFAQIEILDLEAGKGLTAFPIGDPRQIFERLFFTGDGRSLVLITRDPTTGRRSAQLFDSEGKAAGLAGPATDFGTAGLAGKRVLVAWDRGGASKDKTLYTVTTYDLATLAKVGKPRFFPSESGLLKDPELRILSWLDGYTRIIGVRPGGYDKKRDLRMPDRAGLYDVLSGTFVWETDIADLAGWAAVNGLRRGHPNRSSFVVIAADESGLEWVDTLGRHTPLPLAMPFDMYDLRSLVEQEDSEARVITFSLALDPLNPQALERQKADKPFLDVYTVAVPAATAAAPGGTPRARHVVRAPLDERPVGWTLAGNFLAILRKHKSFSRGGPEIEVYRVSSAIGP